MRWIVADEAAFLTDEVIAALRPMRAQRPEARFVMLSTANTRTDPFWSAWEAADQSCMCIQVTVDVELNAVQPRSISTRNAARLGRTVTSANFSASPPVAR